MAINVKANLKKAVSRESLKDLGWATLGAISYTLLPTTIKQNGTIGLLIAGGGTWLVGAIFGLKGMQMAAAGITAAHLMYVHANEHVEKLFGRPIWSYNTTAPATTPKALYGLANYMQNPYTGETIAIQSPSDLPALPEATGVNDYLDANTGASLSDSPLIPGRSWIP